MKLLTFFFFTFIASANVCTNANIPAQGPFLAIVNGLDRISWSSVRVTWTSDFSPSGSTLQQVNYATSTEWTANPGVYPHTTAVTNQIVPSATSLQTAIVTNLIPSTLYHFQPQSFQGSLCSNSDSTFTTLAKPSNLVPTLPTPVDTTRPTLTGTHWIYNSNCGTSGTITVRLQNCLDLMVSTNGDDLGIPPGVYPITQINLHNSENAVNITCSTGTSLCSQTSGTGPANGSQVIMGGQIFGLPPSPLNPGIPYKIISSSGGSCSGGSPCTFGLSFNGTTPIALLETGSLVSYIPFPITQPRMAIHSTAASNLLPPIGVKLNQNDLVQYTPNMPIIQALDPLIGRSYIQYAPLTMNLTWENVGFSVDPTVATTQSLNPTDPQGFIAPIQLGITNQGIVYDQVAVLHPGAPTRIAQISFNGTNNAIVNSYVKLDWFQPHYQVPSQVTMTVSGNVITIPAANISYPNSSGTKVTCVIPAGTITISGAGSGALYLWTNSNCTQGGSLTNGLTATTTITGLTITNAVTANYPFYTYTSPTSLTSENLAGIPFSYPFTITSGNIVDTNTTISQNWFDIGNDFQRREGSSGIEIAAWGPIKIDNNFILGSGIAGVFLADDLTLGSTPCGTTNPCNVQAVIGNLSVTRNSITTDTDKFFYSSANWDGGNRYWRNINEQKTGRYSLYDGNIIGPFSAQVGEGECALHEEFENQFIPISTGTGTFYPAYADSSDWTFTNNTCLNMPSTGITTSYSFQGYVYYAYPISNLMVQNNLLLNNNAFNQVSSNQPFRSDGHVVYDRTNSACGRGGLMNLVNGENFIFNHNTILGMGGCQPFFYQAAQDLTGTIFTDNFFNLVNDTSGPFPTQVLSGTNFATNSYLMGSCANVIIPTLFTCINNLTFSNNVMLGTYSNSFPGSLVDMTTAEINNATSVYFAGFTPLAPTNSTLAARISFINWLNPATNNFRLKSTSPYIIASIGGKPIGIDQDKLDVHQGIISNVRAYSTSSTSMKIFWYAPDSFNCVVDFGTTTFYNGSGTWTRDTTVNTSRLQSVTLTGLTAHSKVYYKINGATFQPIGSLQLP